MSEAKLSRHGTIARLKAGGRLYMEYSEGARRWWFEDPYAPADEATVLDLMLGQRSEIDFIEAGDSLFGEAAASQTWIVTGAPRVGR